MANAAGGYTDSGLAFERKWVEGLRTFSTTRPSAPWRSASTGPAVWRHYPVWTPLPIWSEWPESLVPPKPPFEETLEGRKCATAAKAAASLRSPRPSTVIDARGRRQPAVGTGMKELRMQLAAVAAEVAARAAHAQEVTGGQQPPACSSQHPCALMHTTHLRQASSENEALARRLAVLTRSLDVDAVRGARHLAGFSSELEQLQVQMMSLGSSVETTYNLCCFLLSDANHFMARTTYVAWGAGGV